MLITLSATKEYVREPNLTRKKDKSKLNYYKSSIFVIILHIYNIII
jgi:hypothetical protein